MGAEETRDLKKWLGTVLGLVIMLTGVVWGITWWSLRAQVADHELRLRTVEVETGKACERVNNLDATLNEIKNDLKEVKSLLQKRR